MFVDREYLVPQCTTSTTTTNQHSVRAYKNVLIGSWGKPFASRSIGVQAFTHWQQKI